ncbi:collagen alpha-1(X) chain [Thalassophryne amazonica]|uniref:collagen alpha-1(X) chain n=1 Tax=Thalassophryne amazonica TaxID=390379 RepID=UPI001470D479|nr:collagen alpha-1(X) chain [Thalassophryne amazonica]
MVKLLCLFLLGTLCLCFGVGAYESSHMLQAALNFKGPLPCGNWDCSCAFKGQSECCCGAKDLYRVEESTFSRLHSLWGAITELHTHTHTQAVTDLQISFKASLTTTNFKAIGGADCFGPFTIDVPIPYSSVSLNHGGGYSPFLGIFTAPRAGVYIFSVTVYSFVEVNSRLYHKVQLMKNGQPLVAVWQDNQEDAEDSATQVVVLMMNKGCQVYVNLAAGRNLCCADSKTECENRYSLYNTFTGHLLYPL